MKLQKTIFGKLPDGSEVLLFTLKNDKNVTLKITNYGAIITSIETPDQSGKVENIACGFEKLEDYLNPEYLGSYPYFGCIVGRFGNRIANGKLEIEGKTYQLAINNGANHLHGGLIGYDRRLWHAEPIEESNKVGLKLSLFSPDMEENYPGNLNVTCIYTLDNENELKIEYFAETDKTTVINLTNHTYFNLTGGKENILNHELQLPATQLTELDELIPVGRILPVEGTPFDFTSQKKLIRDMATLPTGYDQNFVLGNETGDFIYAGSLSESTSRRKVEVFTTQPGIQLYTGYYIPELEIDGKKKFGKYSGVALETQHYPDSPHHKNFPSTILKPGETYHEVTVYKFS